MPTLLLMSSQGGLTYQKISVRVQLGGNVAIKPSKKLLLMEPVIFVSALSEIDVGYHACKTNIVTHLSQIVHHITAANAIPSMC